MHCGRISVENQLSDPPLIFGAQILRYPGFPELGVSGFGPPPAAEKIRFWHLFCFIFKGKSLQKRLKSSKKSRLRRKTASVQHGPNRAGGASEKIEFQVSIRGEIAPKRRQIFKIFAPAAQNCLCTSWSKSRRRRERKNRVLVVYTRGNRAVGARKF